YAHALHLLQPRVAGWATPTLTCSAQTGAGIPELWAAILDHRRALEAAGAWEGARREQAVYWMWRAIEDGLRRALADDPEVRARLSAIEADVRERRVSPDHAAGEVIRIFRGG